MNVKEKSVHKWSQAFVLHCMLKRFILHTYWTLSFVKWLNYFARFYCLLISEELNCVAGADINASHQLSVFQHADRRSVWIWSQERLKRSAGGFSLTYRDKTSSWILNTRSHEKVAWFNRWRTNWEQLCLRWLNKSRKAARHTHTFLVIEENHKKLRQHYISITY